MAVNMSVLITMSAAKKYSNKSGVPRRRRPHRSSCAHHHCYGCDRSSHATAASWQRLSFLPVSQSWWNEQDSLPCPRVLFLCKRQYNIDCRVNSRSRHACVHTVAQSHIFVAANIQQFHEFPVIVCVERLIYSWRLHRIRNNWKIIKSISAASYQMAEHAVMSGSSAWLLLQGAGGYGITWKPFIITS